MRHLRAHPRLYLGEEEIARLRGPPVAAWQRQAAAELGARAEQYAREGPCWDWKPVGHNAHLRRARQMQERVFTLLGRWWQTGEERFGRAVTAHLVAMGQWEDWSWIAWRRADRHPDAEFDLSYGENSLTLAVGWDALGQTMDEKDRGFLIKTARERGLRAFLRHTQPPKRAAWWFGREDTNWNAVCAGGAGVLALAFWEEAAEASELLARADESIAPFLTGLEKTGGGWVEGIGYWEYGMTYAFRYLLSWERATGERHPLLEKLATAQTLRFPLDFCPNGVPAGFGDSNHWGPSALHYAVAQRLGREDILATLDAHATRFATLPPRWGGAAEWLALRKPTSVTRLVEEREVARAYPGLEWAVLADRMPHPKRYLSIRAGRTDFPHAQLDLLSCHWILEDEALLRPLDCGMYLDTTFSPRRWEIFEMSPAAKNTVLINGVGIQHPAHVSLEPVTSNGAQGFRLDATSAMGKASAGSTVRLCVRVFLMLPEGPFVVVDRIVPMFEALVETRWYTPGEVSIEGTTVRLQGQRHVGRLLFGSSCPAVLLTARPALTLPKPAPHAIRWCTETLTTEAVLVAALVPEDQLGQITLMRENGRILVTMHGAGWIRTLPLTDDLRGTEDTKGSSA